MSSEASRWSLPSSQRDLCPSLSASKLLSCQQHLSMDWASAFVLCPSLSMKKERAPLWMFSTECSPVKMGRAYSRLHKCISSFMGDTEWLKLHLTPYFFLKKSFFHIGKLDGLPLSPELSVLWKHCSCTLLKIWSVLCEMGWLAILWSFISIPLKEKGLIDSTWPLTLQ